MNETTRPKITSDVPWPTSDDRVRALDHAAPAAADLLNHAVQGVHDTVDRIADRAAPAVRQLGESVSDARDALHEKADRWRGKRDEWIDGMRSTVRGNPLASVAAALALGAVIARITR